MAARAARTGRGSISTMRWRPNKLSAIVKKLSRAAKIAAGSSVKTKARLVKKCGKLSAQDMEQLDVLKK